jgi:DtxR family Mn-dependent transcriptional regulator
LAAVPSDVFAQSESVVRFGRKTCYTSQAQKFVVLKLRAVTAADITHRSPVVEDYAKAIYSLGQEGAATVATSALAERLEVTPGSVSAMVRKLDELGLAEHTPYRGVRLTAEAEVLEHVLSSELEQIIAAKLGDPTHDPHGDPIPSADFSIEELDTRSLDELNVGEAGLFARVSDSDPDMLRYLAERSIRPGERFEVLDRQPFGGPLTVRFEGGAEHALGGELARAMRVEVET